MWQLLRIAKSILVQIPGGAWLLEWVNPLHIAQWTLRQAIQKNAHYANGCLLDLGCGAQPYRKEFDHVERYVGLDVPPNAVADAIGDGMALPFKDSMFDSILCNEVLEHVPEPWRLMSEIERTLKPNGVLLLTAPQTWGLHLEPNDFYRYTKYGLSYLAERSGLEIVLLSPTCGVWATLAQRLADTVIYTYGVGRSRWMILFASVLLAPILMVGYGLDRLLGRRGDTLDNVLVARKARV